MKKLVFVSAAALLITTGAALADTNSTNSYVSVFGGPSFDPHLSIGGTNYNIQTGFNAGARAGTYLDNWLPLSGFSIEADGFYNQSQFTVSNPYRLSSASFMGDLIYHIPTGAGFGLYGGGGIGAVNDMLSGTAHGTSTVLGWQAIGGIEVPFTPEASLFSEYRYQNAHDANIGGLRGVGNTSNNLSVGVKFNL